jgi:hypothetical protein
MLVSLFLIIELKWTQNIVGFPVFIIILLYLINFFLKFEYQIDKGYSRINLDLGHQFKTGTAEYMSTSRELSCLWILIWI